MDITPTLPLIMTVLESLVSFLNTFCLLLRFCPVDTDFHVIETYRQYLEWLNRQAGEQASCWQVGVQYQAWQEAHFLCQVCTSKGCEVSALSSCTAFLEQPKVSNEDSDIHDSLMQLIKKTAINEGVHANLFGKVSEFISSMTSFNKWIQFLNELTYFDSLLR